MACNAPLGLALLDRAHPVDAFAFALLAGGIAAVVLGLLAWGNALKLLVLLLLVAGAWVATWTWLRGPVLPWQLVVTVPVLALLPWAILHAGHSRLRSCLVDRRQLKVRTAPAALPVKGGEMPWCQT